MMYIHWINNFDDYFDLIEHEIKNTTYISGFAPYPDLYLEIYSEERLTTNEVYDNRDDLNFSINNFSFICNNITPAPA